MTCANSAEDDHVAIDGKTLRGTFRKASEKSPLHSVSAWSAKYGLTLGQSRDRRQIE